MLANPFERRIYLILSISLGSAALFSCASEVSVDAPELEVDDDGEEDGEDDDSEDGSDGGTGDPTDEDVLDDFENDDDPDGGAEAVCGDGELAPSEACDDGNTESDDGCADDCLTVDDGFVCSSPGEDCTRVDVCGDGVLSSGEECDDGNETSADGCSPTCAQEPGYVCVTPGEPCVFVVECGDGTISAGFEQCDDGNAAAGDGCDGDCMLETGWTCPEADSACEAAECGDGTVAGNEECEDGNDVADDGCTECLIDDGFVCGAVGMACRAAVCGDGVVEGGEPCDDGDDNNTGDGCSPGCLLEPNCDGGLGCTSLCGDGIVLVNDAEACDDGNLDPGDGCSDTCQMEDGWSCMLIDNNPTGMLEIPIVYRDFKSFETGGHVAFQWTEEDPINRTDPQDIWVRTELGGSADTLPDGTSLQGKPVFKWYVECDNDSCDDLTPDMGQQQPAGTMAAATCNSVPGAATGTRYFNIDGRDATFCGYGAQDFLTFSQWYLDTDGVNQTIAETLVLTELPSGAFRFESDSFFPLTGRGFGNNGNATNFHFTSELRYWFEYDAAANATLTFDGDDDVWVFVNGRLTVDISGTHGEIEDSVVVNGSTTDVDGTPLDLVDGNVYEIALFQAERNTSFSNYQLTINGFNAQRTECVEVCGDGIVTRSEQCDDGEMNGQGYGFCEADCTRGPRCGDGVVQSSEEECDNGTNLDAYQVNDDACAPECMDPGFCGDGIVDPVFGEECDEGDANDDDAYEGCTTTCQQGPRCGDGITQDGELCDDGNRRNGDGCNVQCEPEVLITR